MGITERRWFEDEEPELTEQQLEDAVKVWNTRQESL